jgi:hypothetical protein
MASAGRFPRSALLLLSGKQSPSMSLKTEKYSREKKSVSNFRGHETNIYFHFSLLILCRELKVLILGIMICPSKRLSMRVIWEKCSKIKIINKRPFWGEGILPKIMINAWISKE